MEVEAIAKSRECSSSCFIERLPLADQGLQTFSEKSAQGTPFLGRQDAGFTEQIGVELEGDVGFHRISLARIFVLHYFTCSCGPAQDCTAAVFLRARTAAPAYGLELLIMRKYPHCYGRTRQSRVQTVRMSALDS